MCHRVIKNVSVTGTRTRNPRSITALIRIISLEVINTSNVSKFVLEFMIGTKKSSQQFWCYIQSKPHNGNAKRLNLTRTRKPRNTEQQSSRLSILAVYPFSPLISFKPAHIYGYIYLPANQWIRVKMIYLTFKPNFASDSYRQIFTFVILMSKYIRGRSRQYFSSSF
jgi:hypothetical protein